MRIHYSDKEVKVDDYNGKNGYGLRESDNTVCTITRYYPKDGYALCGKNT